MIRKKRHFAQPPNSIRYPYEPAALSRTAIPASRSLSCLQACRLNAWWPNGKREEGRGGLEGNVSKQKRGFHTKPPPPPTCVIAKLTDLDFIWYVNPCQLNPLALAFAEDMGPSGQCLHKCRLMCPSRLRGWYARSGITSSSGSGSGSGAAGAGGVLCRYSNHDMDQDHEHRV